MRPSSCSQNQNEKKLLCKNPPISWALTLGTSSYSTNNSSSFLTFSPHFLSLFLGRQNLGRERKREKWGSSSRFWTQEWESPQDSILTARRPAVCTTILQLTPTTTTTITTTFSYTASAAETAARRMLRWWSVGPRRLAPVPTIRSSFFTPFDGRANFPIYNTDFFFLLFDFIFVSLEIGGKRKGEDGESLWFWGNSVVVLNFYFDSDILLNWDRWGIENYLFFADDFLFYFILKLFYVLACYFAIDVTIWEQIIFLFLNFNIIFLIRVIKEECYFFFFF